MGQRKKTRPFQPVVRSRGPDAYWLSLRKRQDILADNTDHDSSGTTMTDDQAVAAGYISLSPVRLHHTPAATLDMLSALML